MMGLLSVLAAVMEGGEAFEWAALRHEAEYSTTSRGDLGVFMLSGGKQIVISAVVFVLSCWADLGTRHIF